MNETKIALICNPVPEQTEARRVMGELQRILSERRIPHFVFGSNWPQDFVGYTQVWIVGGDGTLNWFINLYPDIEIPLTIFAGGTGNDFHWMLYGELSIYAQAEAVLKASPKKVDAGICNGKLFINGVGIGFDGAIVKDLLGKKKLAGKASYLISILKNIVSFKEVPSRIQTENESFNKPFFILSIANGKRYGGGFYVAPKANVTDGLLDLNLIDAIRPLNRIRYLPVLEKGEHLELPIVTYRQIKEVQLEFDEAMHAHLDGEYLMAKRFQISILPERFSFLY